ncbi:hypothetical protein EMIT0215P_130136 [Pseudomonas serboccidentalis]
MTHTASLTNDIHIKALKKLAMAGPCNSRLKL